MTSPSVRFGKMIYFGWSTNMYPVNLWIWFLFSIQSINYLLEHETFTSFQRYSYVFKPTSPYRNPRNINWTRFQNKLSEYIQNNLSTHNDLNTGTKLDIVVEIFNSMIQSTYLASCLEKTRSDSKNHWWNAELSNLRRHWCRRLLRLYLARKDTPQWPACHEILRRCRNKYSEEIDTEFVWQINC